MVWGTSRARRHGCAEHGRGDVAPKHDVEPPIVARPTAQCSACEIWTILADRDVLPKGWTLVDGEILCSDCAPPRGGALRQAVRAAAPAEPKPKPARFHGCRIGHEIAFGIVAIQIRAGATPPAGRDDRVQFLLAPHELDELIIELAAIRAKLTQPEKTNG
jgi:hypothetical protein